MHPDDLKARDFTQFFSRHLVGLGWYEGRVNAKGEYRSQPEFHCASGFLMQLHGSYYLATAGHVVIGCKERKQQGIVIAGPRILDVWSPRAKVDAPIPFDFADAPALLADEEGIDFALIKVPNLVVKALVQTIEPVTEENWISQPAPDSFAAYAILGVPACEARQFFEHEGNRHGVTTYLDPRVIVLERCVDLPPSMTETKYPRFVAKIRDGEDISDIQGMSGGPIFGFNELDSEGARYWPIAVQSSWLPSQRILIGTPLPLVASMVYRLIESISAVDS